MVDQPVVVVSFSLRVEDEQRIERLRAQLTDAAGRRPNRSEVVRLALLALECADATHISDALRAMPATTLGRPVGRIETAPRRAARWQDNAEESPRAL